MVHLAAMRDCNFRLALAGEGSAEACDVVTAGLVWRILSGCAPGRAPHLHAAQAFPIESFDSANAATCSALIESN